MSRGRARVRITAGAERDLAAIYRRRLAQRGAGGDDGAEALLDWLVAGIAALAEHPLRGPVPSELDVLGIHAYRQFSLPPFRIVYLPDAGEEDAPTITVMLIADARRDFRLLLEERLLAE